MDWLNMVNTFNQAEKKLEDIIDNPEFINRGKYFNLIENNILPYFDRSRIHISIVDEHKFEQTDIKESKIKGLMAKDENKHINSTINPILSFLDLEKVDIDYEYYYVGKYNNKNDISSESIDKLKNIYKPENLKLFDFIGREIESWT